MTSQEILGFVEQLQKLYDRFHITDAMIGMWAQELITVEPAELALALRRYIVQGANGTGAHADEPPRLLTLLTLLDMLKAERRLERARQQAPPLETVVRQAAERDQSDWARGHYEMFLKGVAKPGRAAEAVAFCREMAQQYPKDAADWRKEAQSYEEELTHA